MSKVELQDVRKSFGSVEVIHGVDVTIEDGEFVVLVGPSGCGKSTLLRMIGGLERITSGRILLGGQVVNRLPPKERDCAMVFQNYALYPHMTVFDNMGFSLLLRRADKQEIARRVEEAAEILGLPEHVVQTALIPVAYTLGTDFRPAKRPPASTITHWNGWRD